MNIIRMLKRFWVCTAGAAIAGIAAPALLFVGAGAAQAMPDVSATTITTQRPGHVLIHVEPPLVSPPLVWGPFPSLEALLAD